MSALQFDVQVANIRLYCTSITICYVIKFIDQFVEMLSAHNYFILISLIIFCVHIKSLFLNQLVKCVFVL